MIFFPNLLASETFSVKTSFKNLPLRHSTVSNVNVAKDWDENSSIFFFIRRHRDKLCKMCADMKVSISLVLSSYELQFCAKIYWGSFPILMVSPCGLASVKAVVCITKWALKKKYISMLNWWDELKKAVWAIKVLTGSEFSIIALTENT